MNTTAWWVRNHFTRSDEFETIGYIGPPHLRHFMLIIAAQKTGYKADHKKELYLSRLFPIGFSSIAAEQPRGGAEFVRGAEMQDLFGRFSDNVRSWVVFRGS